MKTVINQKAVQRIKQGHPWIYRSDLINTEENIAGTTYVYDQNETFLASAFYSPASQIALRIYSYQKEAFDSSLVSKKLKQALALRKKLYPNETTYRLFFGESDFIPSLIIDRYDNTFCFQTLNAGLELFKPLLIEMIVNCFAPQSIIERNDAKIREKENLPLIKQSVYGNAPEEIEVQLNQIRFLLRPFEGQKTACFLDQRKNVSTLQKYFSGKVLDTFSYEGNFALPLTLHADSVTALEISESACQQLAKNKTLNKISNLEIKQCNVFDFLKETSKQTPSWDAINLDPPAFVKSKNKLKQALRGYKEINLRAMKSLKHGGILSTFSCSQHMDSASFQKMLLQASKDAGKHLQILERLGQSPDHPILQAAPETDYLKGYLLRVLDKKN